jgi:hypothetical protein
MNAALRAAPAAMLPPAEHSALAAIIIRVEAS